MGKKALNTSYIIPVGQKPGGIAIADLDGNGKKEILVTNSQDGTLSIIKP
jgi:hypothetical protein